MINSLNIQSKQSGDTLEAQEFNQVVEKVNELVQSENSGGVVIDPSGVISTSAKGNVTVGSTKNINLEPAWNGNVQNYNGNEGDIALKPGDDIQFLSHHRAFKKRDKVVIKNADGSDNPVKLNVVAGEIELSVGTESNPKNATLKKSKTTGEDIAGEYLFKPADSKVLDVKILTGNVLDSNTNNERDERGYLKVRAQAIDLRCEKHGGIALQPKGYDSEGNMNKIKFEHGGGDGLEFGTFNAEKSSIFTDEYRFNKDGIWKMAVREKEVSGKTIIDEGTIPSGKLATAAQKYKKNNAANNTAKATADQKTYEAADDFYDFIDTEDPQTTTEAIIKTSGALNNKYIETSQSSKKNVSIKASNDYKIVAYTETLSGNELTFEVDKEGVYTKDELKEIVSGSTKLSDLIKTKLPFLINGESGAFRLSGNITPKISIESEEEVDLDAKYGDVVITSGDTVKVEAPEIRLNALNEDKSGGTVNFGATQDVIFLTNKLTKSLNVEASATPVKIKMLLQNNYQESVYWDNAAGKFRIPVKHLYKDSAHEIELTPSNYADGVPVYFEDGTLVPADYTCFIANDTGSWGTYVYNIYKVGTKGSSAVLKKNLGEAVAVYTKTENNSAQHTSSLGEATSNTINNVEFEDYDFDGTGCQTVASEEYVSLKEIELTDVIDIISELKTMKANNQGPWSNA